jgi:phage nucleotide-binding protein
MAIQLTEATGKPGKSTRIEAAGKAATRIHPASAAEHLAMVVYSRNKVGKTVFACSSNLKTLIIDCNEQGSVSVRKRPNVDVYDLRTWDDLDPIYWYLRNSPHDYKVVVIDTITMLAMVGMKYVLKDDFDRDMNRDPMTPDKRSWGKLGEMIKDATIKFRNLKLRGMHVIFLAQEKKTTSEDEDGGTVLEIHPELSPAPRSVLLSSVDIIGRLYAVEVEKEGKKNMERRMLLGSHPKYVSGNRFEELRKIERNPNLQNFLDRIGGAQ